jgi:uncharacterized sporulation protein YeaH/YhbH (DUF444 family)
MHEKQDEPFVITEARNIGRGFWREMQAYRQTVEELQEENEELKRTLYKSMYALQDNERLEQENTELRAEVERLKLNIFEDFLDKAMNQPTQ